MKKYLIKLASLTSAYNPSTALKIQTSIAIPKTEYKRATYWTTYRTYYERNKLKKVTKP